MKIDNKAIVFYTTGTPGYISAANTKFILTAKSLLISGYSVYFFSKSTKYERNPKYFENYQGIKYRYLNFQSNKSNLIRKIKNEFRTFHYKRKYFKELNRKYNQVYCVVSFMPFILYILDIILFKYYKVKIIISIMEWHKVIKSKFRNKIDSILFDNFAFNFCQGAIPISRYINNEIKAKKINLKTFILPVLCDYKLIDEIKTVDLIEPDFFLYCGSAGYHEIIDLILNSFKRFIEIKQNKIIYLRLILSGNDASIEKINQILLNKGLTEHVIVRRGLTYHDLISTYKKAIALLIPLRPTIQDAARFPHKIAEYSACGKPIISTNWGEIPFYFQENVNILFTEYTVDDLCRSLCFVIDNENLLPDIGEEGKKICKENFDYKIYAKPLAYFFESI